jgi:tRNA threonylcarbamoyl adenosine modification protein YeaZ
MGSNLNAQVPLEATYGLAIHTSSPDLGLALGNFKADSRSQTWPLGRDLALELQTTLQAWLAPQQWSDLAWLAVAVGPGSFTATRIGVVAARTLAQQLEIPLFGVSTLAAIAWHQHRQWQTAGPLAVQLAAQRGQMFGGIFQASANQMQICVAEQVWDLGDWQQVVQNQTPEDPLLIHPEGALGYSATALLELAHLAWMRGDRPHWSEVVPFYGQHPVD